MDFQKLFSEVRTGDRAGTNCGYRLGFRTNQAVEDSGLSEAIQWGEDRGPSRDKLCLERLRTEQAGDLCEDSWASLAC